MDTEANNTAKAEYTADNKEEIRAGIEELKHDVFCLSVLLNEDDLGSLYAGLDGTICLAEELVRKLRSLGYPSSD
jgi:hypothetical protein